MIPVVSKNYGEKELAIAKKQAEKFLSSVNFITKLTLYEYNPCNFALCAYLTDLAQPYYDTLASLSSIKMENLNNVVIAEFHFHKGSKWELCSDVSYVRYWDFDEYHTISNIQGSDSLTFEPELNDEIFKIIKKDSIEEWVNEYPKLFDSTYKSIKLATELLENEDLKKLQQNKLDLLEQIKGVEKQIKTLKDKIEVLVFKQVKIFNDFN
jgi:hypothetical protein